MILTAITAITAVVSIGLSLITLLKSSAQTDSQTSRYKADLLNAQRRETVEFGQMVISPAFRTEVSSLAWQVFIKWLYWETPEDTAIAYKKMVCWGFLGWEKRYQGYDPTRRQPYQLDRPTVDHFASAPKAADGGLSEHDALTIWLETWSQLSTMLDAGLADTESAVRLLSTHYGYSLPFLVRFIDVMKAASVQMSVQAPTWVGRLESLERMFAKDDAFRFLLENEKSKLSHGTYIEQRRKIIAALESAA